MSTNAGRLIGRNRDVMRSFAGDQYRGERRRHAVPTMKGDVRERRVARDSRVTANSIGEPLRRRVQHAHRGNTRRARGVTNA